MRRDLAMTIERLPERCRSLLALRYSQGYEPPELAKRLGYSPTSISKTTNRCLAALTRGRGVLGRAHAAGVESSTSFSSPQPRSRSRPPWSVRSKWIGVIAIRPAATAQRSVPSASS